MYRFDQTVYKVIILSVVLSITSCVKLDLAPLSQGSTEEWYSNEDEINLSLNDLYRFYIWDTDIEYKLEKFSDNWTERQTVSDFAAGTITSEWSFSINNWLYFYKGIARCNNIMDNLVKLQGAISPEKVKIYEAEVRFIRATIYSKLIFYWGDVPFMDKEISIEEAFKKGRDKKQDILPKMYEDFDFSIDNLPEKYGDQDLKRATKGAALAFKARAALYMQDYELAREAAKACMDMGIYTLHEDFGKYFLASTKNHSETIFAMPRAKQLDAQINTTGYLPRNNGGNATVQPSWDLFFAFLCSDGLPVDESPLFDPKDPFKNRDPRLTETVVSIGEDFLGFIYDPNPYAVTTKSSTGQEITNQDNRAVNIYASYNGLLLKKGVDMSWADDRLADPDIILMRYADVLLMYAEAKIELNDIDQSTLDAINMVRARAYKADVADTEAYPAITTMDQNDLRRTLRTERRMELAWENRRFDDLIRWRLAEKALTRPIYGMLDPNDLKTKVVDAGLWFFPGVPEVDEDGLVDFSAIYDKGLIKILGLRNFDPSRQYLWPIPSVEILANDNMTQNPNY